MEVKSVGHKESKSIQEQEEQFASDAEAKKAKDQEAAAAAAAAAKEEGGEDPAEIQLDDSKVLDYFKKKHNKEFKSLDDLLTPKETVVEKEVELPEDVSGYMEFKKKTNLGMSDYLKLNRNFDEMDDIDAIRESRRYADPEATDEEIDFEISEEFGIDEELDEDDPDFKKVMLKRKKEARKAKKALNEMKESQFKAAEQGGGGIPEDEKEAFEQYKQSLENADSERDEDVKKARIFQEKTNEVFGEGFKGFEIEVSGQKLTYKPGDAEELKNAQSSPMNFINKHLDENGVIKDAKSYHLGLAMAMDPVKAAAFFYEKGAADRSDSEGKKIRNVNYTPNSSGFSGMNTKGVEVKSASPKSTGGSLKIRQKKRT